MSRFSCGVAPRTSVTCSSHDLPKIVTTGVSAATSSRRFGSSAGAVRAMAGRPERGELRGLPAHRPRGREELDVLGVGARPAALDVGHPVLVEHPRDAQLVGERERDVLALRAVAQGRVVEDDRAIARDGHAGTPAAERLDRRPSRTPVVPTTTSPSSRSPASARSPVRQPSSSAAPTAASIAPRHVLAPERQPQHHRRRQDRADRVGAVLAGDVRRRAVDRLVQAERAVGGLPLAERRRRQHAEGAGEHRRLVGQDVAEQVLGDDDVEVGGRLTSSIAHESTSWWLTSTSGCVGARSRRRPSATGATSRGRSPCRRSSAGLRRVSASSKASRHDPPDLALRVRHRVERAAIARRRPLASCRSPK